TIELQGPFDLRAGAEERALGRQGLTHPRILLPVAARRGRLAVSRLDERGVTVRPLGVKRSALGWRSPGNALVAGDPSAHTGGRAMDAETRSVSVKTAA